MELPSRPLRFRSEFGGWESPLPAQKRFLQVDGFLATAVDTVSRLHYNPRWAMVQQISPSGREALRAGGEMLLGDSSLRSATQVWKTSSSSREKRVAASNERRRVSWDGQTRSTTKLIHATKWDDTSRLSGRYTVYVEKFSKIASLPYQHSIYSLCGRPNEKRHPDAAFAESPDHRVAI